MSEHKPLPVAGYSSQSEENVALVNQNKILEERVLRQLDLVASFSDVDPRWAAIARTHLEQGFMAMNRAVFRPGRITGDLPSTNS
jgi:hypothetical protein